MVRPTIASPMSSEIYFRNVSLSGVKGSRSVPYLRQKFRVVIVSDLFIHSALRHDASKPEVRTACTMARALFAGSPDCIGRQ